MDIKEQDDKKLLLLIQQGSHYAFAEIVQRHSSKFYALAYRYMCNKEKSEDIVQTAFLKLWEKPHMWNAEKEIKFTTWFYKIIVNLCLDNKKKKKPMAINDNLQIVDKTDSPEDTAILTRQQKLLEKHINTLPKRQRTALNLCVYEELSHKDAADVMNVNLKTMQSLVMRAKTTLRNKIGI